MIKFSVVQHTISPVEVEQETASTVVISGRRRKKISDHEQIMDTWEAAVRHVVETQRGVVARLAEQLAGEERKLLSLEKKFEVTT